MNRTVGLIYLTASLIIVVLTCFLFQPGILFAQTDEPKYAIVSPQDASYPEALAAKELRRYLYLRTGELLPVVRSNGKLPSKVGLIVVGRKDRRIIKTLAAGNTPLKSSVASLEPQQYWLKTVSYKKQRAVIVTGGDSVGTLYAAYRFIEHFGIRFYLHGDTIPDEKIAIGLPELGELGKPLFKLRGVLPFHDFPEGPDWWDIDDYKAILAQLPKLRMNFIGLHTYPESAPKKSRNAEPAVWVGLAEHIDENGQVNFSYPSRHFTTFNGTWGYRAMKTGDYSFGAAQLFDRDDYGADYMKDMTPWPKTPQRCSDLFNRFGAVLREAFTFAHQLGIKTCVGTETPLKIPQLVKEYLHAEGKDPTDPAVVQQLYEGIFRRIMQAYPVDYYWLWTPEEGSWQRYGVRDDRLETTLADFRAAIAAAKKVKAPFTLATCGWVLGPPRDRSMFDNVLPKDMPISCINNDVGEAPVEPGFSKINERPRWAIPWLEDDPALTSPQLWVGRMRKDAADALAYGCTGLMGIHWRTRTLAPNVSALAHAAWDPTPLIGAEEYPPTSDVSDGTVRKRYYDYPIANTDEDPLYQTIRRDLSYYRLSVPNGVYTLTLSFCDSTTKNVNQCVFDVVVQGKKVLEKLDIFAAVGRNAALDYTFEDIKVTNGRLNIEFVPRKGRTCISAIAVHGESFTKKTNCGGPAYLDYARGPLDSRYLPTFDFYRDWALHEFGPNASLQIAQIFERMDGYLPRPSKWREGPGAIRADLRPWESVSKEYGFVDDLAKLRLLIKAAGNLERFDYWLNTFRFMKAMARMACTLGELELVVNYITDSRHSELNRKMAQNIALPLRQQLVQHWGQMLENLLATVSNPAELGTIANLEQHSMGQLKLLTRHDEVLEKVLGQPLPEDTKPWKDYRGPDRLIVPTVRTTLMADEDLKLKAFFLAANQPKDMALYWRPMGNGQYDKIALTHVARSVYSVTLPAEKIKSRDIEYHIKVISAGGKMLCFPAAAPHINQTVVVAAD